MTYRELLETVKKHPDYFKSAEERNKMSDYRFRTWVDQKSRGNSVKAVNEGPNRKRK
jgi:hypothetical protein